LPESAPVLEGASSSYQLGERVVVNCTSLYSKPAATLQWYINNQLVTEVGSLRKYPPQKERDGLETAVLGLTFITSRSHFPRGEMRLKCVAKIATVYFQSQETSVIETGFLPQTQAEERRHNDHFYFLGSSSTAASAGWSLLILVALVILFNT
ncbi:putative CD80-like C2-set immunoglobulin domain-containing protein 4, partial [Homarus americanus]